MDLSFVTDSSTQIYLLFTIKHLMRFIFPYHVLNKPGTEPYCTYHLTLSTTPTAVTSILCHSPLPIVIYTVSFKMYVISWLNFKV